MASIRKDPNDTKDPEAILGTVEFGEVIEVNDQDVIYDWLDNTYYKTSKYGDEHTGFINTKVVR